jgi:AcrR family transcriptional regulator
LRHVTLASGPSRATDGRTARSAKTRDAIADALLDLLTEGDPRPTARKIADRAGVSLRSVYVHFDDLEDLYCIAAARHYARIAPTLDPVPARGTLRMRAEAVVRQRIGLYMRAGGVGKATERQAPFSPTLGRIVREARQRSRRDLERVFAPELAAQPTGRRAITLALLDVLSGPRAWETFTETHAIPPDEAARAIVDAIVEQLGGDA